MAAFDTNVVVRLLVRDDEEQCDRAEKVFRLTAGAEGAFIPVVVVVETAWVLRVAYKFDRKTIAGALRRLVSADGVIAENEAAIMRALDAFEVGSADFSDYLILDVAHRAEALPLWTFDERLAQANGARRVP